MIVFFLPSMARNKFSGRHFGRDHEVIAAIDPFLEAQDASFYKECIFFMTAGLF